MNPRSLPLIVVVAVLSGCTTFTTVRSAEVTPGPAVTVQASLSTPPGEDAAWFWTYECGASCNNSVNGSDLVFAQGLGTKSGRGATVGFGTSGVYPYVEVYTQLGASKKTPFGVGGRLGIPASSWSEHRVYARLDFASGDGKTRLLWNPGIVVTTGASPNGENPGTFIGIANGVGLEMAEGNMAWTPSLSIVSGRAGRTSYGQTYGPSYSTFATAAMSVTFRRKK